MTTHNPKFRGTPGPWRVDGHEHKNGVVEYTIVSISGDAVGCGSCALFADEDDEGQGWCELHQESVCFIDKCSDRISKV